VHTSTIANNVTKLSLENKYWVAHIFPQGVRWCPYINPNLNVVLPPKSMTSSLAYVPPFH